MYTLKMIFISAVVVFACLFAVYGLYRHYFSMMAKLDRYVQTYVHVQSFSGSVLVAQRGKILLCKGYGMANYELDVPNTPGTKFYLASVGKQFTAMGILKLVQLGKLRLEDTVATLFSDYPRGKDITIYQLLTHTSGIPDYANNPVNADDSAFQLLFMQPGNTKKTITFFKNRPLEFEPGTQYKYSNSGYTLLAAIIEKVSGKSCEQWLKETVFVPLGMHDTGVMHTLPLLKNRASRYQLTENGIQNAHYIDLTFDTGAGGLYSTVEDLYKWDRALYADALISQKLIARMITPCKDDYCLGWVSQKILGYHCIWHNGALEGAHTVIYRFVDDDICIIILSNILPSSVETMAKNIAAILFGQKPEYLKKHVAIVVNPKIYDQYVGTYKGTIDNKNATFVVTKEQEKLFIERIEKKDKREVYPEAETEFFLKSLDVQFSFIKDKEGKVTQLVLHQQGNDMFFKKME